VCQLLGNVRECQRVPAPHGRKPVSGDAAGHQSSGVLTFEILSHRRIFTLNQPVTTCWQFPTCHARLHTTHTHTHHQQIIDGFSDNKIGELSLQDRFYHWQPLPQAQAPGMDSEGTPESHAYVLLAYDTRAASVHSFSRLKILDDGLLIDIICPVESQHAL
jgi:hypothetical protein